MRAAAIVGLGCSTNDLRQFQTDPSIEWRMGVPEVWDEVDAVVLFGGDGTIHRHLHHLVRLAVPVLVVPAGSGNDFARAMGFGRVRDSLKAWQRFCAGEGNIRTIDLGAISQLNADAGEAPLGPRTPTYFGSVAGIGLDSEVARRANNLPRWLRGHGGYILGLALAAVRFEALSMRVSAPDESGGWTIRSDQTALLAACANTAIYGAGMRIAPQARVDDGRLDVCVIGDINPLRLFCMFPTVYFGRHLRFRDVLYFKAPCVRIETEKPFDVYADGEFVCHTPVEIGVRKAALRVLTP